MAAAGYKILYVAGIGRNGGTILDRILGHVPGFVSTGELRFIWLKGVLRNELCNCGEPFRNCWFWKLVAERAFGGMTPEDARRLLELSEHLDRSRYAAQWLWRSHVEPFAARAITYAIALRSLHDAIASVSDARVVVNSSKFAGYGFALIASRAAPVYVLHLIRDSRATAYSWSKKILKPEVQGEDAYMRQYRSASAAMQWNYRNATAELLRLRAAGYRRVRYEDFAAQPAAVVTDIVEWLGEPSPGEPFVDAHTVELGETHTQSGNPSRFRSGRIDIVPDEEWRERMPLPNRALVTGLTAPWLARYGYLEVG
ncbi:MAG TPA: sulfotransferase [Candidatus Binatia bacterium]|nr:sulfotransferase [Candidatus Binatia bacterium]